MRLGNQDPLWHDGEFAVPEDRTAYPRSADQRLEDRVGVSAQAGFFTGPGAAAYQAALLREINQRAAARPHDGQAAYAVCRGDREVLATPNELLLRAERLDDATRQLLVELGFDVTAAVDALGGRVKVIRANPGLEPDRLDEVLLVLQSRGIPASLNHLTPLGPWAKGQGGPEPTDGVARVAPPQVGGDPLVAVIDTGVNTEGRGDDWLAGLQNDGNKDLLDVFGDDQELDFAAGHGTFVAGVVQQVAPAAPIRVYKALNSDGMGSEVAVAEAIVQAAADGAKVVNLSLGTRTLDDQPPVAIDVALEVIPADVVVVAAAGNYGDERPVWPAAFRQVVSVAALSATGQGSPWSTRGFWVDLSVVGEGIVSTYVQGQESAIIDPYPDTFPVAGWAVWSGTSFAAPQVAGLIARLMLAENLSAPEALQRVSAVGVRRPDFGRALRILPGT
ncbi:S8 family serine peptidase [Pseudonocardia ailaonensis]|uniref:S8 family serine peptidase n=1 Tax=Pseudonocardia ailaonensis TaxID=367279 RepID=A0ABN2NKJ5_9PSEU